MSPLDTLGSSLVDAHDSTLDSLDDAVQLRGQRKTLITDQLAKSTRLTGLTEGILRYNDLSPKQKELYDSLKTFYTKSYLTDVLIPIQTKQKPMPIRLRHLEHLVTSYADSHDVSYIRNGNDNFPWQLYRSYQDQLLIFNKRYFDPCRRGQRVFFQVDDVEIETTLAQLNFFRWAIQNKVIEWAIEHAQEIQEDMVAVHRAQSMSENKKRKRKRSMFNNAASPMILNVQIQVKLMPTHIK